MKQYKKIDLYIDGFYWNTTQRYPTLSKALQALKSQAPVYTKGKLSQFLTASFQDSPYGSRRIKIYENPPFYAHNLYEKKTHGLNLKQMRRLYAMVSRGNQKAITYARNVLGIPFSESPTQVKAVVYHHVRDLAERRVRRNPAGAGGDSISPASYEKIWNRNFEVNNLILLKEFWPGAKYDPMGAEMLARSPWKLLPADVKRSLRRGFESL